MTSLKAAATPISGSYSGNLTAPIGGSQRLDLRIDVDVRISQGKSLNRVSGDIFRIDKLTMPGRPPKEAEVYQESWILEAPRIKTTAAATVITGVIRFWNSVHPKTTVKIRIPQQPAGAAAEVTIERQASPPMSFACLPAGMFLRALHLEIDVCASVNAEPTLPRYGTHSLKQRPPGLADRVLTLERSYAEAGVGLVIREDERTVIDDSALAAWTDAELHNAMEHHFKRYQGPWPKWEMWGLLAGRYQDDLVGGLMFDYASADSGAGQAPERQGFAVFRKHEWFNELVPNPTTTGQFEAARKFLWTFVHESGHAFNLLHSFDKNRENARSWMNYDWKYDSLHGEGSYWKAFAFSFDDEELLHIRHGNRSSVIMGGDPWSSGGHAESPPGAEHLRMPPGAMTNISGEVPLEILVRSQAYFEFLELVSIEVRARNLLPIPVSVSATLHPEHGSVTVFVRRPDGRIVEYMPISCKLAQDPSITLSPVGAEDASDRHSRTVFVSYGRYGFYFDEPGQYYVRAVYHGPGNMLIPSNVQRLRVGHPKSEEADRRAQDFFSYEAGASLYLGGSRSQFLSSGMDALMGMIEEQGATMAAAKTAARIARGVGLPFYDLYSDAKEASPGAVLLRASSGEAEQALRLTDLAVEMFLGHPSPRLNIVLERVVRTRADLLLLLGEPERAQAEMMELASNLAKGGVKPSVITRIARDAANIDRPKRKWPSRGRSKPARRR
jgi:hypothetical protein